MLTAAKLEESEIKRHRSILEDEKRICMIEGSDWASLLT
jgi:hypothetical protein